LAGVNATLSVDLANSLLTTVTWTASYATTADTFGTIGTPTKTQIATGTFTVNSTVTNYTAPIAIPAAATTGIEILLTVGAQTSGTWTIGNMQLEAGSVATPFERRDYGRELIMCQRYYETGSNFQLFSGYVVTNEVYYNPVRFTVTKRTAPSVTPTYWSAARFAASAPAAQSISEDGLWFSASATTTGTGYFQYAWVASAEL
jgi:hypothetical protein